MHRFKIGHFGRNSDSGLKSLHMYLLLIMENIRSICYKLQIYISHGCIYQYVASSGENGTSWGDTRSYSPISISVLSSLVKIFWGELVNVLPMHARSAQEGILQKNILCLTPVFCTCIIWLQLSHLHACWRHLWHVHSNVIIFVTRSYECQNIPWWESMHS